MAKDKAAQALGRKRWKGKSAAEIQAATSRAGKARADKLSAAKRRKIAKMGAQARWAKKTSETQPATE